MTGSPSFPTPQAVRYAPRSDGSMETLRLRCPASLNVCLPVLFDSEQLATLEAAASRANPSLTTWVGHALLAAAAEPTPAVENREKAAA